MRFERVNAMGPFGAGAAGSFWAAAWLAVALTVLATACGGSPTRPDEAAPGAAGQEGEEPSLSRVEAERRLYSAVGFLESGQPDRARLVLAEVEAHEELAALAAYNLGVAAQLEGDTPAALRSYQRAVERDPHMAQALLALLRLQLAGGDVDGAEMAYQRALSASENDLAVRAVGLEVLLHRGQYESVLREAREVLLHQEDNIEAHLALARAYHALHQSELAKLVLREGLRRDPERADLWLMLATIFIDEENEVAAIQNLREALAVSPSFVEAHNNLGLLLLRARNHDEAIRHLERATDLRPDFIEGWLNLSNAYKAAGRLEESERAIRRALQLDPGFAEAYFNLGLLFLDTEYPGMSRIERYEAAIRHFNRYRSEMGAGLPREDPVEAYINEATTALEAERALGAPPAQGDEEDPFGDDDFEWDDDDVEWID